MKIHGFANLSNDTTMRPLPIVNLPNVTNDTFLKVHGGSECATPKTHAEPKHGFTLWRCANGEVLAVKFD